MQEGEKQKSRNIDMQKSKKRRKIKKRENSKCRHVEKCKVESRKAEMLKYMKVEVQENKNVGKQKCRR